VNAVRLLQRLRETNEYEDQEEDLEIVEEKETPSFQLKVICGDHVIREEVKQVRGSKILNFF